MSKLRISDAPLLPNVNGAEKIPTGGRGDYAVSVDQIKDYVRGGLPQQIEDHINDTENPHQVSKSQVGLGEVDNTSDVDKPISTVTQQALDLKANTLDVDNALNLKANIEDVNVALSFKSDKTYVDTQDNLKADKVTTYTKIEVDGSLGLKADKTYVDSQDLLKANKTYVDNALTSFSNGAAKFYPTLVEANADIANIAVNDKVEVGEVANGGTWYKATAGATTLTKSAYDPLTQAKADAATKIATSAGTALTSTSDLNTLAAGNYYITLANLNAIVDAGTASALGYPVDTPRRTSAKINVVRAGGGSYSLQTIEFINFGTRYTRQGNVGGSFNTWVAPPVLPALQFGSITLADNLNEFVTAGQWGIDAATVATNSTAGDKGYPADLTAAAAHFTVSVTSAGNAVQLLTHLNKTRKRVVRVSNKTIVENWTLVGATSIYATEAAGRVSVSNGEVFWVYPNSSNTLEDLTLYKRTNATTSAIEFVQGNLNNYLINEGASWE